MTRDGGAESRPYTGPDRPQRRPDAAPSPRSRPTPSRPFVPISPAGPPPGPPPPLPPGREPAADPDRPYEDWGDPRTAIVGPPAAPTHHPAPKPTVAAATGPTGAVGVAAGRAGAVHVPADQREAVATALETVALRVRTGELEPRGFEPGMSDAAAVATALTALLTAPG